MSDDLSSWLAQCGCQQYLADFVKNDISFDLVPELDTAALREIGVFKVGDRIRLELAIADLKSEILRRKVPWDEIRRVAEQKASSLGYDSAPQETSTSRLVTFILPDGSLKKVNVEGCFNAQSIKRKVLRNLGVTDDDSEYDTYIHTVGSSEPVRLYDVEFVTICFSAERVEKHRIMLTPKNEPPTATAAEQSLRILQRVAGRKPSSMRNFFGQRPPSELISSNLGEYFPATNSHALEATIRSSVRKSMRLSRRFHAGSSNASLGPNSVYSDSSRVTHQRTIGDVMVHNVSMMDEARHPDYPESIAESAAESIAEVDIHDSQDAASKISKVSRDSMRSYKTMQSRLSVRTSFATPNHRHSRIELLNESSDDEHRDEDDFLADYSDTSSESSAPTQRKWLQGARIGAGSFGTVYLGMDPVSGELMAVKQVAIPKGTSKENEMHRGMIDALQREMTLLKELQHENIVSYLGSSSDENFLNIFLEYIPGGSVSSMLSSYGPFEEPLIRSFVRQVLVGLSYLHGMEIIHRDIKGANILIDIKGVAKISDFGISKKLDTDEEGGQVSGKQAKRASLQGSVYWMAPEVVKQTVYTKKADIWSVGCLVVEMFTGKHPFPKFSQRQAIFKIGTHTRPETPDWCTGEATDFLNRAFEFDHEKRPTAVELLDDAFLTPLIVSHADKKKSKD